MNKRIWMILGVILAIGMISNVYAWGVATPPEKRYEVTLSRPYYVFEVQNMQGNEPIDVVMMVDCDGICTLRTTCNTCRLNANERKNFYIDFYPNSMTPNIDYNVDFYVKKVKSSDEGMIQFSQMMKKDFVAFWRGSNPEPPAVIEPTTTPTDNPVTINVGGNNTPTSNVSANNLSNANVSNDTAPIEETKTVDELEGKKSESSIMPLYAVSGGLIIMLACILFIAFTYSRGWIFDRSNDGYTKRILMVLTVTALLIPMMSSSSLASTSDTHSVALILQEQTHAVLPTGVFSLVIAPVSTIILFSLIVMFLVFAPKDNPKEFIKYLIIFVIGISVLAIFVSSYIAG